MATSEILFFFPLKMCDFGAFVSQKFFVPCHNRWVLFRSGAKFGGKDQKKKKVVYLGLTHEDNILD
jgi:hypothetical protein